MSYNYLVETHRKPHLDLRFENLILDGNLTIAGSILTPSSTVNIPQNGTTGEIPDTTSGNFILSLISPTGDKRVLFLCCGDGTADNDFTKWCATGAIKYHIIWNIGENIKPYYSSSIGAGTDIVTYKIFHL